MESSLELFSYFLSVAEVFALLCRTEFYLLKFSKMQGTHNHCSGEHDAAS